MIFKKKKHMAEKSTHNKKHSNETADKMAHDEIKEEAASAEQNETPEAENATAEPGEDKAQKLQGELDQLKDKYLRMVAEFDNYKRRTAKERMEMTATAGKDIIQSLLTVLDDVDRAGKQLENTDDINLIKEGIALIFNKLKNTMQQKGLKAMDAKNQDFNPDLHDAITEIPAPTEDMKGKIIDVVEQGYYLNDKLIRHAKVVVGK
jgi:molecular chaperone GrpE